MKEKRKKIVTRLLWILCLSINNIGFLHAQDPVYSVYWNDNLYLNPAKIGEKENSVNSFMHFRNQWTGIISRFQTYSAGFDIGLPNSNNGIGLRVLNNVEGEGYQKSMQIDLAYGMRVEFTDEFQMNFGLTGGFISKSIDPSKLVFTDQLDPVLGAVNPTAAPINQIDKASNLNFNGGVSFIKWNRRSNKCENEPIFSCGLAVHNMTQPSLSLTNETGRWPMRTTAYFEYNFETDDFGAYSNYGNTYFSLRPSVVYMNQRGEKGTAFSLFRLGTAIYMRDFSSAIYFKSERFFDLESREALTAILGYKISRYKSRNSTTLFMAYDFTISGLMDKAGRTYEVGLNFKSCNAKYVTNRIKKFMSRCIGWGIPEY